MKQPETAKFLSRTERLRFDAMAESATLRDAASRLGVEPGTLYNWSSSLRARLLKERGHINACLSQRKRSPLLKKVLSVRVPIKFLEDVEEEVDESERE